MESNQVAADGTVYDNGYGICMIPLIQVTTGRWNRSIGTAGGYKYSMMHTTNLPNIVTKLQTILGSHIVQRNVLLSSSTNEENGYSNAYTWTTAYATLMSMGQMTGTFASHSNKYDDGEASYKLPIFNSKEYITGTNVWLRNINNSDSAWIVSSGGKLMGNYAYYDNSVRPLIYLR